MKYSVTDMGIYLHLKSKKLFMVGKTFTSVPLETDY